ncbi:MAG TPA: alkaline phosphatase family protein [Bryobacteraceae bacterium]|nr:alkaline phosphatase family protein [Bryobacteraceae bacterium]
MDKAIAKSALLIALLARAPGAAPQSAPGGLVAEGDYPLNLIEVEHRWVVSANSGWNRQYLQAYDWRSKTVSSRLELASVWYGLAYEPSTHTLLASSGADSVYAVVMNQGHFGAPREMRLDGCKLAAGIAVQSAERAWVACNQSQRLIRFNPATGETLATVPMDGFPYAIRNLPGDRIAVSLWGKSAVAILRSDGNGSIALVKVGSHPNDMLTLAEKNLLLVACSDSDDISWVDLTKPAEVRRSHIAVSGRGLTGAQPDALASDPRTGQIFVALAAVNAVAVLTPQPGRDLERNVGIIPLAGGYPSSLLYSNEAQTLFVADARNQITGPNAAGGATKSTFRNIGSLIGGAIEAYGAAELSRLRRENTLRQQVYRDDRVPSVAEKSMISRFTATRVKRGPIQYVFYILKENRTYDQLFGDIGEGNGSPDLTLFGADVTPNHHALAGEFILYDNFFVDGDVSADGHFWSMAAASTDYVNKFWPSNYSHRAEGVFDAPFDGDADHDDPIAVPGSGFLWDRAKKLGISYRDYGEWGVPDPADANKNVIYLAGLKNHYDPYYRDEIGDVTDQQRTDEWLKEFHEFELNGKLPQLTIIHLPNDHTMGTRAGYPTPRAMVADNDVALGRMVEAITHSQYWPRSIILVIEDDAQDGPDHVDCHRSPLLVISPFARRHAVEHRRFTTASVLKTIEQILAMGSLTYFDDRAPSLLSDFQSEPDLAPYSKKQPRVSLDEKNTVSSPGAKQSGQWDFRGADRAPAEELNKVIWESVRGAGSSPPAAVHQINISAPR